MSGPALDIVGCNDPIVCVLAGPGTGKTYTLMRKVARLLEEGNDPKRILVATFTRTAADDLVRKVSELKIDDSDKVRACTLHSLCYASLRRFFGEECPRPLLKFEKPFLISDLGEEYGNKRNRKKSLDSLIDYWVSTGDLGISNLPSVVNRDFADAVLNWLEAHRAIFLDQLVPMMLEYIENNQECPEKTMFDHILVDEYQDLNVNEQRVIDLLAHKSSLIVIGDDDQSVYGFKSANPMGIVDFPKKHPEARVKTLTVCRRSPKEIVRIANNLIRHNKNRFEKELVPLEQKPDGSVSVALKHPFGNLDIFFRENPACFSHASLSISANPATYLPDGVRLYIFSNLGNREMTVFPMRPSFKSFLSDPFKVGRLQGEEWRLSAIPNIMTVEAFTDLGYEQRKATGNLCFGREEHKKEVRKRMKLLLD